MTSYGRTARSWMMWSLYMFLSFISFGQLRHTAHKTHEAVGELLVVFYRHSPTFFAIFSLSFVDIFAFFPFRIEWRYEILSNRTVDRCHRRIAITNSWCSRNILLALSNATTAICANVRAVSIRPTAIKITLKKITNYKLNSPIPEEMHHFSFDAYEFGFLCREYIKYNTEQNKCYGCALGEQWINTYIMNWTRFRKQTKWISIINKQQFAAVANMFLLLLFCFQWKARDWKTC